MTTNNSMIGQHFAYAHGRLGVLRQVLLKQTDIDRLLGSHSTNELASILTELKLTDGIDQSLADTDSILSALEAWLRLEVEQMAPLSMQPIFHILWLEGDLPLLAFLLKKHHGLTSAVSRQPSNAATAYNTDALITLVKEGKKDPMLPEHLVTFVERIKSMVDPSPMDIDTETAAFVAILRKRLSRTSGSKYIRRFVEHLIDTQNVRTALRLDGESTDTSPFLAGGAIDSAILTSKKAVQTAVRSSNMHYHLDPVLSADTLDASDLERAFSDVFAADIDSMWQVPLSIEPLFAFATIIYSQLRLIRVIAIGKRNNLSPQEIKSLLPPLLKSSRFSL